MNVGIAEKSELPSITQEKLREMQREMNLRLKRKRTVKKAALVAGNLVLALLILSPLLYAVSIAFMPSGELFTLEMNLIPKNPTLDNFRDALTKVPLGRFVFNSFLVAGLITVGQIISCSLAAFSLSFLDF